MDQMVDMMASKLPIKVNQPRELNNAFKIGRNGLP